MLSLAQVIVEVEKLAPPALAQSWDEVGLRWGDMASPIAAMLLTIDLTPEVLAEARARDVQLVLAYHPPLWRAAGAGPLAPLAVQALTYGIAVYSSHTAWDAAAGGANDHLAAVLGLTDCRPLVPHLQPAAPRHLHPYEAPALRLAEDTSAPHSGLGQGRLGSTSASIGELIARGKAGLQLGHLLLTLPSGQSEQTRPGRVAVVAGAGGDLWRAAHRSGAGLLVTGEVRHHDALAAAACGLAQLATLHSHSERGSLARMAAGLRSAPALADLSIWRSEADREPQQVV